MDPYHFNYNNFNTMPEGVKQYRTREQYDDMIENCINGNWSDAGKIGAEG